MRELDVSCLQKNLTNITFCDIEGEDLSNTDPNFIKLFRIAQLMLEYVLHSQEYLSEQKDMLEGRVQALSTVSVLKAVYYMNLLDRRRRQGCGQSVYKKGYVLH